MRIVLPSLRSYRRDTRLLFAIALIYSIAFFGINMLIKRLFVLRLGYGASFLGIFNGIAALAYMGAALPAGALGRRIGPRRMIWLGLFATLLGFALLSSACMVDPELQRIWLLGGQIFLALGWSSINVNLMAALAVTTDERSRAGAYAMFNALLGLGTLVGNLVGGLMPAWFSLLTGRPEATPLNYAWTLFVSFLLLFLAIPPLARLSPHPKAATSERKATTTPLPLLPIALMGAVAMLTQGSVAALASFGSAYMDTRLLMSAGAIGAIFALGKLLGVGTSLVCPAIVRRIGAGPTIILATAILCASILPAILLRHWSMGSLSIVIYLVAQALWSPAVVSYEMDWVPADWRSVMSGTHAMSIGMMHSLFNLGAGPLIDRMGYPPVFLLGGGFSLLATLLMVGIWWGRRSKHPQSQNTA